MTSGNFLAIITAAVQTLGDALLLSKRRVNPLPTWLDAASRTLNASFEVLQARDHTPTPSVSYAKTEAFLRWALAMRDCSDSKHRQDCQLQDLHNSIYVYKWKFPSNICWHTPRFSIQFKSCSVIS